MARTKSSIVWSWWTMSYRAFHAGTVCAFLALREPGTELAERCLVDLRNAITIFDNRSSNWNITHPVQGDLSAGLHRLEKLATAATQKHSPHPEHLMGSPSAPIFPNLAVDPSVPAFPSELTQATGELAGLLHAHVHHNHHGVHHGEGHEHDERSTGGVQSRRPSAPFLQPWTLTHQGHDSGMASPFSTEPLALPQVRCDSRSTPWLAGRVDLADCPIDASQIWASMFNIKIDPETGEDQNGNHGLLPSHHQQAANTQ